ncbi:MAG: hypothetical protein U5L45_24855 [Saprospiraceae bacterium]|nr:hypothetical protein [Saprospiraceae bacterium]
MWFVFRALPEKRTTFPFFASEASNRLSNYDFYKNTWSLKPLYIVKTQKDWATLKSLPNLLYEIS